jgi:hypothetical protein
LWDFASATPSLHPTKLIYKLNNYVKELFSYPILPNGTNIGGLGGKISTNLSGAVRQISLYENLIPPWFQSQRIR